MISYWTTLTFTCILHLQIPIGVLNKDESKIADMVDILEDYQKYVPVSNYQPRPILLFGDGLSCERVNDAKNSRIMAANSWDRFDGFEPAAQECHKRVLLMGVLVI